MIRLNVGFVLVLGFLSASPPPLFIFIKFATLSYIPANINKYSFLHFVVTWMSFTVLHLTDVRTNLEHNSK